MPATVKKKKYPKYNKNGTLRAPPPAPFGHKRSVGNNGGRQTPYREEYAEQAQQLCQFGATDMELARFFKVDVRTIYNWQVAHPKFFQAMVLGKAPVDERMKRSLYQRGIGYEYEERPGIKHVPGDVGAQKMWLCNRLPKEWRDKLDHTHEIVPEMTIDEARERLIAFLVENGIQLALPPPVVEGEVVEE